MDRRFKICRDKIWFQAPNGNECLQFPMILAHQEIDVLSEIPRMTAWFDRLQSPPCAVASQDASGKTGFINTGYGFECLTTHDHRTFAERQVGREYFDPNEKPKYCEGIYEFIMKHEYLQTLVGFKTSASSISLDESECFVEVHKGFMICPHEIMFRPPNDSKCFFLTLIPARVIENVPSESQRMTAWFDLRSSFPCAVNSENQQTRFKDSPHEIMCLSPSGHPFARRMVSEETKQNGAIPRYCDGVYAFIMGDRYLRALLGI